MKVVLFARVACSDIHGMSLAAQLEQMRAYAKTHNLEIADEVTQLGVANPTTIDLLGAYLKQHTAVSAVLSTEPYRVMPALQDWNDLEMMINQTGVELHFVGLGEIWTKEQLPLLKMCLGIHGVIEEYYRNSLGTSVRKGQTARANQGMFPGRAPFGYRNNRGALVEEPSEAAAVRNAYKLFLSGHTSLRNLQQALGSEIGMQIPISTLNRILTSKLYSGQFIWGGREYSGDHPILVDRETFELVQELLRRLKENREDKRD